MDSEGRITRANTQVERYFGYDREELLGRPVEMLVPERFRQVHPVHWHAYSTQPRVRQMGASLEL
jgi:PAS domain S-box-containing protein